ncbi:hypothetical protein HYFRA_00002364 [Hymenoscyphus fraxineus]|uniref:Uncharacterized protein n=1 Tax=Hymenoscyphus fraxineus TaxID=746836 RepID=A0A9N9LB24_9HELO|nr:hypothetical protein HYFRA_00002364 [Hymenoscyphus fraxineus]
MEESQPQQSCTNAQKDHKNQEPSFQLVCLMILFFALFPFLYIFLGVLPAPNPPFYGDFQILPFWSSMKTLSGEIKNVPNVSTTTVLLESQRHHQPLAKPTPIHGDKALPQYNPSHLKALYQSANQDFENILQLLWQVNERDFGTNVARSIDRIESQKAGFQRSIEGPLTLRSLEKVTHFAQLQEALIPTIIDRCRIQNSSMFEDDTRGMGQLGFDDKFRADIEKTFEDIKASRNSIGTFFPWIEYVYLGDIISKLDAIRFEIKGPEVRDALKAIQTLIGKFKKGRKVLENLDWRLEDSMRGVNSFRKKLWAKLESEVQGNAVAKRMQEDGGSVEINGLGLGYTLKWLQELR